MPFALKAVWNESKHRRGQPDNAGQFGPGGGGGRSHNVKLPSNRRKLTIGHAHAALRQMGYTLGPAKTHPSGAVHYQLTHPEGHTSHASADEIKEIVYRGIAKKNPTSAVAHAAAPHQDIRHNPTLDALFAAPTEHKPAAPQGDIRHNPLLDEVFGAKPAAATKPASSNTALDKLEALPSWNAPGPKREPASEPVAPKRSRKQPKPGKPPPLPSFSSRAGMSRTEAKSHARELAGKIAGNFSHRNPNFEDIGGEIEHRLSKHPPHIASEFRRRYGIAEGDSLETMGRKFHELHRGGWSKDPELAGKPAAAHGLARTMSQIARLRSGGRGNAGRLRHAMTLAHSIQHLISMYGEPKKPGGKSFSLAQVK